MQSQHSLFNVCMDDMLSGMVDKLISTNLIPNMPRTHVEAMKVLTDMGLDYVVYDACPCAELSIMVGISTNLSVQNIGSHDMEPPPKRRLFLER